MAQTCSLANSLGRGMALKSALETQAENHEFNSLHAAGESGWKCGFINWNSRLPDPWTALLQRKDEKIH